jgi:hypothetical protein
MIEISIPSNALNELEARLENLDEEILTKAIDRARRETLREVQKMMAAEIAKRVGMPRRFFRARTKIFKSKGDGSGGKITLSIAASDFPFAIAGASESGEEIRASGKTFPSPYFTAIARTPRGRSRLFIFRRRGASRLPLREARGDVYSSVRVYLESNMLRIEEIFLDKIRKHIKDGGLS